MNNILWYETLFLRRLVVSIWLPCVALTSFKFYLHGRSIKLIVYFEGIIRIEEEWRNIKRQGRFSSW